jgi:ribosome-binding protein aMBF1 (putative translation factor)
MPDHQDWDPVVFRKSDEEKRKKKQTKQSQRPEKTDVTLIPAREFKIRMMQARLAQKLTQPQLARLLNMPVRIIKDWESGKSIPNNRQIATLSRVLQTELPRCKKVKKKPED